MDPMDAAEGRREHPLVAAHERAARWSVPLAVLGLLLCVPLFGSAAVDLLRGEEADERVRAQRELDAAWCARECPGGSLGVDDNCDPSGSRARLAKARLDARGCRCDVRSTSIWPTITVDE